MSTPEPIRPSAHFWPRLAVLLSFALLTLTALGEVSSRRRPPEEIVTPLPAVRDEPRNGLGDLLTIPADWRPWWQEAAGQLLMRRQRSLEMTLDSTVMGSLMHSAQVRVLRDAPAIQQTAIAEACAQFDVRTFMESKFVDTSDPVGSTLTTGGPPRYLDQNWTYSAGIRKIGESGARLEAAQKFGYEDSNSVFFVPDLQGTARMTVSLTQPLLNGAGRLYNMSAVVLARIDTDVAYDKYSRDLQNFLLEVQKAYWDLYFQRVVLLQKRRLFDQGRQIYKEIHARRDVDVVKSQLARAKAAVATRGAAVIHHEALVLNAEARLRALVNDPVLGSVNLLELIPIQPPIETPHNVGLEDALVVALYHRPEIDQVTRELRAASVRLDVSKNELLPVFNLILSSYVYGLEGDGEIFKAFDDQFAAGRPSYSAGLLLEYPLGNRAAQARFKRSKLELRQLTNQLEVTTWNVRLDVETAVRDITTAHREMTSHYHAMIGNAIETEYQDKRWRLLPGDHQSAGIALDDLLDAQERLNRSEGSYAAALVAYNVALVQLKRAMGVLLEFEPLDPAVRPPAQSRPATRSAVPPSAPADARSSTKERPGPTDSRQSNRPIAFPPPPIPQDAAPAVQESPSASDRALPSSPPNESQSSTVAPTTEDRPPTLTLPSGP